MPKIYLLTRTIGITITSIFLGIAIGTKVVEFFGPPKSPLCFWIVIGVFIPNVILSNYLIYLKCDHHNFRVEHFPKEEHITK